MWSVEPCEEKRALEIVQQMAPTLLDDDSASLISLPAYLLIQSVAAYINIATDPAQRLGAER